MNPLYAIVRKSLEPLDAELLKRAFRNVPELTPYDINTVCNPEGGFLCRNFQPHQAMALQANLKAEGVDVEIVAESQLPSLPPGKVIHRVRFTPEALMVEDLIKGEVPVPWEQVSLLAAGSVQLTKLVHQQKVTEEVRVTHIHAFHGVIPVPHAEIRTQYTTKEATDWFLRVEVFVAGAAMRYCIEAENFNFMPFGEGVTKDLAADFCLLVRGLAAGASKALRNQGVNSIASEPSEFVYYPRKNSFHDEIIWMLWNAQRQG